MIRVRAVGVLACIFYRMFDEATVVSVEVLVALVKSGIVGAEVLYYVGSIATRLSLTLVEITGSRCRVAVVYVLVIEVVRTAVTRVRRCVGATLMRSAANCICVCR